MIWVLIIILASPAPTPRAVAVTTQTFSSQSACQQAASWVLNGRAEASAACFPLR